MNTGDSRLILFTVAGKSYALPADAVSEILPMARLTHPPGLRSEMEGLLALDGRTIPVFDLARLLAGEATRIGLYTPLLILQSIEPVGLIVERVREMAVVSDDAMLPIPSGQTRDDRTVAEFHIDGEPVHVLDLDKLVELGAVR